MLVFLYHFAGTPMAEKVRVLPFTPQSLRDVILPLDALFRRNRRKVLLLLGAGIRA